MNKTKNLFLYITFITLGLGFYLQVMYMNPIFAIWPYVPAFIYLLLNSSKVIKTFKEFNVRRLLPLSVIVLLYCAIVTVKNLLFLLATPSEITSFFTNMFNFLLPAVVFYIIGRISTENDVKSYKYAIITLGIVFLVFFIYENDLRISENRKTDFTRMAFEYMAMRSVDYDVNSSARMGTVYRSQGLNTNLRSSATLIALSVIAMASMASNRKVRRRFLYLGYIPIVSTYNTTSLIVYSIIVLFRERNFNKINKERFLYSSVAILIVGSLLFFYLSSNLSLHYVEFTKEQFSLITWDKDSQFPFLLLFSITIKKYWYFLSNNPSSSILGMVDGIHDDFPVGGDFGSIETLAIMGIPFFVLGLWYLARLLFYEKIPFESGCITCRSCDSEMFISSIAFILLMDIHYTVWTEKSIMPIMFFCTGALNTIISQDQNLR